MGSRKPESKVEIEPHKSAWRPSLLVDQIVLVTSLNIKGEVHAARKSWLTMVAQEPPMLGLCCRLSHRTAINILESREFVVNIPGEDLGEPRLWDGDDTVSSRPEEGQRPWTYEPSLRVQVPRIVECRGHIECALDSSRRIRGEDMIFFARIMAVTVDRSVLQGPREDRYGKLRPLLFLEEGLFAVIEKSRKMRS